MHAQRIESLDDPRVAAYRNIKDRDLIRDHGLFMAEGRLVLDCLIGQSRFEPQSVFVTAQKLISLAPLLEALDSTVPVYVSEPDVFNGIVGFNFHRGCLAVGLERADASVDCLLREGAGPPAVLLALEGLTDSDNVGAIFRNARAFGAGGVLLCPRCCDPLYRKSIRTSLGATLCVPFARATDWSATLKQLQHAGYSLLALDPGQEARGLGEFLASGELAERVALLFGTEGAGLSSTAVSMADQRVRIEMVPGVDSVNVATAAAIALHALRSSGSREA